MTALSNAAPIAPDNSTPLSCNRQMLAGRIGGVALSYSASADAKEKFGL